MTDELEKLAYEEALRGLDRQEALLKELRARTGALLATSSLAASFLGQQAFQNPRPGLFAVVALIAFVAATGTCAFILHPKEDLLFPPQGIVFYEMIHAATEMGDVYRQLAYGLESCWVSNARGIRGLTRAFTFATTAFLLQTLSLVVLLGGAIL
jgi:hypothetical protein